MPGKRSGIKEKAPEYLLIILSGVLITLPLSYPQFYYTGWIALLPFLMSCKLSTDKSVNSSGDAVSPFEGFKKGWLLGIVIFMMVSFWLYFPLVNFSGLPWIISIFLLAMLFLVAGLFYGLWAWLFLLPGRKKGFSSLWLAISWTGIEYLRYRLLPDLPFAFAGYTQVDFLQLLQLADIGGVFFLSFIVILFNGYLFKLFRQRRLRHLIPFGLILIIIFTFGSLKLNYYQDKEYKYLRTGIVQTSISASEKWKVANIEPILNLLLKKSSQFKEADLIVWPESSLTFDLIRNEYYRKKFIEGLAGIKAYIQVGSLAIIDDEYQRYNSSFLIAPGGRIKGRYNKLRLVPFGEYLPFAEVINSFSGYSMNSSNPGQEVVLFTIPSARWKTAICSEILYPELVQRKVEQAEFIVNQSNEAWYLHGNLQEQMWIAAVFRAVENRRSIVKAGNFAFSGLISPSGRAIIKNAPGQGGLISGPVKLNREETFYQQWGDFAGYLSLGIILLLLLIKLIMKLRVRAW